MRRVHAWLMLALLCAPAGVTAQDAAPAPAGDPTQSPTGAPQETPPQTQEAPTETAGPTGPDLSSPRALFRSFRTAYDRLTEANYFHRYNQVTRRGLDAALPDAVACIADLSSRSSAREQFVVVRQLGRVFYLAGFPSLDTLPDKGDAKMRNHPVEWEGREQGRIWLEHADGRWQFVDRDGAWSRIASNLELDGATERQAFSLRHYMPAALQEQVMGLDHWQWLGILALLVIAWMVHKTVAYLSGQIIAGLVLRRTGLSRTSTAARENRKGIGILAAAGIVALLDDYLMIPSPQWQLVPKILASVGVMLLAYRVADLVGARLEDAADRSESKLDDQLAPMARKILKVFITAGAVLFVLENLEVDIWSLLAGLGVIGIGVGLAAKDTFANFFGSITVLADKPFQIGDWVVIANVEGTVEEIGFRSTRIRTFYNSLVTVPNSKLVDSNIDNLGRRSYRRYKTQVGITYDTPPDRISEFCEGIRAVVRAHPHMRQDYFLIHLNEFGPSSLDILVYVFFQVENWSQELAARQEFILSIIQLAEKLDVKFAFPSQSLYIEQAPPHTSS